MGKVLYSAVVLTEDSREKLLQYFNDVLPSDWEIICHHMTINMGKINDYLKDDLGKEVDLIVEDFAFNDKVMAVGVYGYPSKNKQPHITLAVNRKNDGKPVMSNNLENWKPIKDKIKLKGIVQEIKSK